MATDVPVTIWQPTDGIGEYVSSAADNIVDQSGTYLVDPSGVFIVSLLTTFQPIPSTVWVEDDSI